MGASGNGQTPTFQFETANDDANNSLSLTYGRNNSFGAEIFIAKHRGSSVGGTTIVQGGDRLGALTFAGSDGTNFQPAASIEAEIDATPGTDDMPGRLVFSTTADGAKIPTERMRIDSSGNVNIPNDSGKLQIGASQDLQIYHDGSNSIIDDAGTGSLLLYGSDIILHKTGTAERMADFAQDGAVKLYHDNSKKLETSSNGVDITSGTPFLTVTASDNDGDATLSLVAKSQDGSITGGISRIVSESSSNSSGASAMLLQTRNSSNTVTTAIRIDKDQDITLPIDNQKLRFGASQDLEIYHDGSNSIIDNAGTGSLLLYATDIIFHEKSNPSHRTADFAQDGGTGVRLYYDNSIKLQTNSLGVGVGTSDTIIFNHSSSSAANDNGVVLDGAGSIQVARHNDQCLLLNRQGTDGTIESFYNDGTYVGGIGVSGGTTVYATSSDYRLKENVVTLSNAITRLKTLKPYRFNFIGKSLTMDGFFAHEVTAVPEAIVGEKDAEEMQGLDYAKLTPLLTAALQEAISKIETLETKVAALEAA